MNGILVFHLQEFKLCCVANLCKDIGRHIMTSARSFSMVTSRCTEPDGYACSDIRVTRLKLSYNRIKVMVK